MTSARRKHVQDDSSDGFFAIMRKQARYVIYPYGWWTEKDGSHVIFDRGYRPICRVRTNGAVEITRSNEWIYFRRQSFLYNGCDRPQESEATRAKLNGIIERLGLADEIESRRVRQARRELPYANHPPRKP